MRGGVGGGGSRGRSRGLVGPGGGVDTNFGAGGGEVRVVPEAMSHLWNELTRTRTQM